MAHDHATVAGLRSAPLFVGTMLIGMIIVWQNTVRNDRPDRTVSIQQMASYGEALYFTIVTIELTLVLLAAPAATAGASASTRRAARSITC